MKTTVEGIVNETITGCLERVLWSSQTGLAVIYGGCVAWTNPRFRSLVGASGRISLHEILLEALDGDDEALPRTLGEAVVGPSLSRTVRIWRLDGSDTIVELTSRGGVGEDSSPHVVSLTEAEEDSDRRRLELSRAQFGALADHAPVAVCVSDVGMRIGFANERMATTWGVEGEALLGNGWLDAVVEDERQRVRHAIASVLAGNEAQVAFTIARPDGTLRQLSCNFAPVEREDHSVGFVGTAEDVTDLRQREAELAWQATHDPLTSLANRQKLRLSCAERLELGTPFALFFIDLDDFKLVNDGLGHAAGDELLKTVARRLEATVSPGDLVCRLGGDEFVVVVDDVVADDTASEIGGALLAALVEPAFIEDRNVEVGASVGVVLATGAEEDVELLLRDADVAMYQAKRGGKGRVASFDDQARDEIVTRLDVLGDLRSAIREDRIGVAYQPIIDIDGLSIVGAEALLRYVHPEFGPIAPLDLIELAETSGMSQELGLSVLRRSIAQLRRWQTGLGPASIDFVSVNVSARELLEPGFVDAVYTLLADHHVHPSSLMIELTESHVMQDVDRAISVLDELVAHGVRLAIDDFGTGYSSLAYLARLPFHIVKVDKSFVRDLPHSTTAIAIIEALVAMTHSLGGRVLVEGIEHAAQLEVVTALGCSLVQGYLLGHPESAGHVTETLAAREISALFAPSTHPVLP